jgi:RNA polymerase sigma factor (sigma-70 family)
MLRVTKKYVIRLDCINQQQTKLIMNQAEFIKTISPFKDKVFRLARRLLVSTEEAEDATQEVLVKLWNGREKLSGYKSVEALAMTMTKNYCLDRLKSKQAGEMRIVHTNYSSHDAGLQQQAEDRDTWGWAEKIMAQLPEQQRLIMQMRDIEQYEFEEIAKIMDMNETAVRVALSRARKTLREELTKTHSYGIK